MAQHEVIDTKTGEIRYIEDIPETPISTDQALTDDQLKNGGLVKTEAWMRTKSSKGALRVQKHREAKEAQGLKQLNIVAPVEIHEQLKAMAKAAAEGKPVEIPAAKPIEIIKEVVKEIVKPIPEDVKRLAQIGSKAEALNGWRRTLAEWLGIL